ncbi:MAG: hypothetical protein U5L45_02930 [Saprospiraceae bacterium]|nr:hypothetical protein [Saprospiraceae bacterium]
MWFVFRLRRKTNHVSSLLHERSERKTSVFNQKTMFLGYAHPSISNYKYFKKSNSRLSIFFITPIIVPKLAPKSFLLRG